MATSKGMYENILRAHSLEDFLKERHSELIFVKANDTVEKALTVLSEHHILSAPVQAEDGSKFVGLIDMVDIMSGIIKMYTGGADSVTPEDWQQWCSDIEALDYRGSKFGHLPVSKLINMSGEDPFLPVNEHGSFFQIAEELFARGVHRAPITNDAGKILGMVSQSDVISLLAKSKPLFSDPLAAQPIGLLEGVIDTNFTSVTVSTPAIHSFYLMALNKESSVALISNETGAVMGNLSASDLRALPQQRFSSLLSPVGDFVARKTTISAPGQARPVEVQTRRPALTVTPKTTLGTVIQLLASNRIHQLWVVDENQHPVGVVRTKAIVTLVSKHEV